MLPAVLIGFLKSLYHQISYPFLVKKINLVRNFEVFTQNIFTLFFSRKPFPVGRMVSVSVLQIITANSLVNSLGDQFAKTFLYGCL